MPVEIGQRLSQALPTNWEQTSELVYRRQVYRFLSEVKDVLEQTQLPDLVAVLQVQMADVQAELMSAAESLALIAAAMTTNNNGQPALEVQQAGQENLVTTLRGITELLQSIDRRLAIVSGTLAT